MEEQNCAARDVEICFTAAETSCVTEEAETCIKTTDVTCVQKDIAIQTTKCDHVETT